MPSTLERSERTADERSVSAVADTEAGQVDRDDLSLERPVGRFWFLPAADLTDERHVDLPGRLWSWVQALREEDGRRKPVVVVVFDADAVQDEVAAMSPASAEAAEAREGRPAASAATPGRGISEAAAYSVQQPSTPLPDDGDSDDGDVTEAPPSHHVHDQPAATVKDVPMEVEHEALHSVVVEVGGKPIEIVSDDDLAVASPLHGMPVVMKSTRRWSSTPLNDDGNPAIWRFTSQDGGKVVPT